MTLKEWATASLRIFLILACLYVFVTCTYDWLLLMARNPITFNLLFYYIPKFLPFLFFALYLSNFQYRTLFSRKSVFSFSLIAVAVVLLVPINHMLAFGDSHFSVISLATWSAMFLSVYYVASRNVENHTAFYLALFSCLLATDLSEVPNNLALPCPTAFQLLHHWTFPLRINTKLLTIPVIAHICLTNKLRLDKRLLMAFLLYALWSVFYYFNALVFQDFPSGWVPRAPTALLFIVLASSLRPRTICSDKKQSGLSDEKKDVWEHGNL